MARTAAADSDGYFCTAPGILAWETRGFDDGAGHRLHVVRFSAAGIRADEPIALEDFQVHGMRCAAGRVELYTLSEVITVTLADRGVSRRAATGPPPPTANLGHYARPGVIDVEGIGGASYQLVIARADRSVEGGIEHFTVTELIRRSDGPGAPIIETLTIFRGVFLETVN